MNRLMANSQKIEKQIRQVKSTSELYWGTFEAQEGRKSMAIPRHSTQVWTSILHREQTFALEKTAKVHYELTAQWVFYVPNKSGLDDKSSSLGGDLFVSHKLYHKEQNEAIKVTHFGYRLSTKVNISKTSLCPPEKKNPLFAPTSCQKQII